MNVLWAVAVGLLHLESERQAAFGCRIHAADDSVEAHPAAAAGQQPQATHCLPRAQSQLPCEATPGTQDVSCVQQAQQSDGLHCIPFVRLVGRGSPPRALSPPPSSRAFDIRTCEGSSETSTNPGCPTSAVAQSWPEASWAVMYRIGSTSKRLACASVHSCLIMRRPAEVEE